MDGELGLTRGTHLREIVAGVIAGAGQRRGRDEQEALGPGDRGIAVERLGRDEFGDLRMPRRRLKILAHGEEIDVGRAHVVHHLMYLEPFFAQPQHDARLGEDRRVELLDALQ